MLPEIAQEEETEEYKEKEVRQGEEKSGFFAGRVGSDRVGSGREVSKHNGSNRFALTRSDPREVIRPLKTSLNKSLLSGGEKRSNRGRRIKIHDSVFLNNHIYFLLVGGFALNDLLDKPLLQVSALPRPGRYVPSFLSRIRLNIPTAGKCPYFFSTQLVD